MRPLAHVREDITNTVADIERIRAETPAYRDMLQAEDREAFEIVRRIERRLKGHRVAVQEAAE